jgi:hypothetical protein
MPNASTSFYYNQGTNVIPTINITGQASWDSAVASGRLTIGSTYGDSNKNQNIHPVLAFKFIKKKFGMLESITMQRRLVKLEKAFYQAIENGQEALGNKFLRELAKETRESTLYAKGVRNFVEREDVLKVKNRIRSGHISDSRFEDFTRVIPKDVLKKKKEVEGFFDGFIIYHYYNIEIEDKIAKKQKMSPDEKFKMKDPILFGYIKETDRLYFIADWEDEYCDLTFEEIVDVIGENKLTKYPIIRE